MIVVIGKLEKNKTGKKIMMVIIIRLILKKKCTKISLIRKKKF